MVPRVTNSAGSPLDVVIFIFGTSFIIHALLEQSKKSSSDPCSCSSSSSCSSVAHDSLFDGWYSVRLKIICDSLLDFFRQCWVDYFVPFSICVRNDWYRIYASLIDGIFETLNHNWKRRICFLLLVLLAFDCDLSCMLDIAKKCVFAFLFCWNNIKM